MSNRDISCGGKGGQHIGLTALPHSCANCPEMLGTSTPEDLQASPSLYMDSFTSYLFTFYIFHKIRNIQNRFIAQFKPHTSYCINFLLTYVAFCREQTQVMLS
jgi:hypothetical protein